MYSIIRQQQQCFVSKTCIVATSDVEALGITASKWLIRAKTLLPRFMHCHYSAFK
jgi:hypothetical protein